MEIQIAGNYADLTIASRSKPRVLLVDDDLIFGRIMKEIAADEGIELHAYDSLLSMGYVGRMKSFDAVILDVHLDHLSGLEIARYLDQFIGDVPAILISSGDMQDLDSTQLPQCVHCFVPKNRGYKAILHAALEAFEEF